ncbi:MAG: glycerol-3-phosphate dehydrogenase/oxidase [Actinobacteria bacterium]|nr:glycerol-3-phosphate dehydrogenase/oxidase [Actinomycetota bacterium]
MTSSGQQSPSFDRREMVRRLADETFDVVVVGGGVTGAGVALDAASRGLRTALVERDDFASGTSSKSSKLVHGGLRYLQQGEVRLVYEALHERQRLRRNAPHLVRVLPFLIPILGKPTSGEGTKSVVSRKIARAMGSAMWMYDLTGGWRIGKLHRRLRKDVALAHMPTMPADRLLSAYLYYDAFADDARLVLTLARSAAAHGAAVVNRCAVTSFVHDASGRVAGVRVLADGTEIDVRATVVVNAAGVWSDDVRARDEAEHPDSIRPAKGVHLTVPWHKVRNDIAVVIPVPKDKRSLFVVPWGPKGDGTFEHTYVGTTDTDYTGPLDDPQCTSDDIAYVLRALNASIDPANGPVTTDDVTGVWAGLRPLVKAASSGRTADLSRRHRVTTNPHGVITVTGGKLTTYREMAEDTVDAVVERLGRRERCRTKRLRLLGAEGHVDGAPGTLDAHLRGRYGALASEVQALIDADPSLGHPLVTGLPYVRAEALYAVRHEMARTVDDVLSRRTRARLFDRAAAVAAAAGVAQLLAPELGWDDDEVQAQIDAFCSQIVAEHLANNLTEAELFAHGAGADR